MKTYFTMQCLVMLMLVFVVTNVGLAQEKAATYQQVFTQGQQHRKNKQHKQALASYQEAKELAKTPTQTSQAYIYIGHSYRSLRQWAKANEVFNQILKNDKFPHGHQIQARYHLAVGQRTLKQLDEAKANIAQLLAMEKVSPIWQGYAYLLDSEIASQTKDYKYAIQAARKGLALEKINVHQRASLQLTLAHALRASKQYDEAIKAYQKMLEMKKTRPNVQIAGLHHLGVSYMNNKQLDEAIDVFRRQLETFPKQGPSMTSWAKYRLALCLLQQKKTDEAKELFEQVVKMPKANKHVKPAAQKQLDKLNK